MGEGGGLGSGENPENLGNRNIIRIFPKFIRARGGCGWPRWDISSYEVTFVRTFATFVKAMLVEGGVWFCSGSEFAILTNPPPPS